MGGKLQRGRGIETIFCAPVDIRFNVVFKSLPVVGHNEFGVAVSIEVFTDDGKCCHPCKPVAFGYVFELAWRDLLIHVYRPGHARIMVVEPGGRENEVQTSRTMPIDGGDIISPDGR
jgi:hypothetical protein